jgi:hypothetical protein
VFGDRFLFSSEFPSLATFLLDDQEFLPRVGFSSETDDGTSLGLPEFSVQVADVAEICFDPTEMRLTLLIPEAPGRGSNLLRILAFALSEVYRQRRSTYLFHAASIVRNGSALMICAPAEGGKTTLALELCRTFNFELQANDCTVLTLRGDDVWAVQGDPGFRFRRSSLHRYDPKLAEAIFAHDRLPSWNDKMDVPADAIGLKTFVGQVPVCGIVFARLDDSTDSWTCAYADSSQRDKLEMRSSLHRETSYLIKGNITPLDESYEYVPLTVPSFDSGALNQLRFNFLRTLSKKVPIWQVRGRLSAVSDVLAKRFAQ